MTSFPSILRSHCSEEALFEPVLPVSNREETELTVDAANAKKWPTFEFVKLSSGKVES